MFVVITDPRLSVATGCLHHDELHELLDSIHATVNFALDTNDVEVIGTEHLLNIKMWSGHVPYLIAYGTRIIMEMEDRSTNEDDGPCKTCVFCRSKAAHEMYLHAFAAYSEIAVVSEGQTLGMPPWMGESAVLDAHKRYLMSIHPEWYRSMYGMLAPLAVPVPPELGEAVYEITVQSV